MSVLLTVASDLGEYAAAEALLQSLRSSDADPVRRVAAAHAVCLEEREEGQSSGWGAYEGDDAAHAFAVGSRRFPPAPVCGKCGKPGVEGCDFLGCCGTWLVAQMFCNLCHSPTRKSQFERSGCRGRWCFPMCGADDDTGASPGSGHEVATPEEMALVMRHYRRTAALRERQSAERAAAAPRGTRSTVGAVTLLAISPSPPADAGPSAESKPPAPPTGETLSSQTAIVAAAPLPATDARNPPPVGPKVSAEKPPKGNASPKRGGRGAAPAAAKPVMERSMVVYKPPPSTGGQPTVSPPLDLTWTVVAGNQVPLFSKGEFEKAVRSVGGRLLTSDDSETDVTVFDLILRSGERITHIARKRGPYTILTGDYDASGDFVTSPTGTRILIVDSGAMVNLLGKGHAARLRNRRDPDPNLLIFAAGDHRLIPVSQGTCGYS